MFRKVVLHKSYEMIDGSERGGLKYDVDLLTVTLIITVVNI